MLCAYVYLCEVHMHMHRSLFFVFWKIQTTLSRFSEPCPLITTWVDLCCELRELVVMGLSLGRTHIAILGFV